MKNVKICQFNGYCTDENGRNYCAVKCTENGISGWRLAVETKPGFQWDFITNILYPTCAAALNTVRIMELYGLI